MALLRYDFHLDAESSTAQTPGDIEFFDTQDNYTQYRVTNGNGYAMTRWYTDWFTLGIHDFEMLYLKTPVNVRMTPALMAGENNTYLQRDVYRSLPGYKYEATVSGADGTIQIALAQRFENGGRYRYEMVLSCETPEAEERDGDDPYDLEWSGEASVDPIIIMWDGSLEPLDYSGAYNSLGNLIFDGASIRSLTYIGPGEQVVFNQVEGGDSYTLAQRAVSKVTVPGRDGSVLVDEGYFQNVEQSYTIFMHQDAAYRIGNTLRRYGNLGDVYKRLEDSWHPGTYRLARFQEIKDVEMTADHQMGKFTLVFDCKPQRFQDTGDEIYRYAEDNPDSVGHYYQATTGTFPLDGDEDARPYIEITAGTADITLFGFGTATNATIVLWNNAASGKTKLIVDCENRLAYYEDGTRASAHVKFGRTLNGHIGDMSLTSHLMNEANWEMGMNSAWNAAYSSTWQRLGDYPAIPARASWDYNWHLYERVYLADTEEPMAHARLNYYRSPGCVVEMQPRWWTL